ncbi:MAG: hypothetical protein WBB18_10290, partial [Nodosilinea sp.]
MGEHDHSDPDQTPKVGEPTRPSPLRNFLIGMSISGLFVFVYLSLSVDMVGWATVGSSRLAVAIAVPVLCGLLSAFFGQRAIQFLTGLLDST